MIDRLTTYNEDDHDNDHHKDKETYQLNNYYKYIPGTI